MFLIRNTVIILNFVVLAASLSVAQTRPQVSWGAEFKASKHSSLNDIVGFDQTGIYALKERFGLNAVRYTLEHFDNEHFAPTKSFDIDFEEDGNPCYLESILYLRSKLYLFSSVPNSGLKRNILSVQRINKKDLVPEKQKRNIAEIDFSGHPITNAGYFQIKTSRDSSKIIVLHVLPYHKKELQGLGITVLDNQFQLLWTKQIKLPYEDGLFDLASFRVDNDGDVYLLGLIYNEKRKSKRQGAPNYKYHIFAYRDKGKVEKEYPMLLKDKFLTDMQIEVLHNKDLICAGFYSHKGTYSIRGTFFLTIDHTSKEIKTQNFREFGIDFITQNMNVGEAAKAIRKENRGEENELYEYDLNKILIGKDGSAILLGEQYYSNIVTTTQYFNGMPQTTSTWHYYYNDIIAVKIDPEGQIIWAEKIAKRQHTTEDKGFYSSYALAIVKGDLCFIFNDNPKNVSYSGTDKVFNYRGGKESLIMLVTLDQSGKQNREPLFSSLDMDVIARPKVCEQIKNNEVILFGQRKKTQQFARVSF